MCAPFASRAALGALGRDLRYTLSVGDSKHRARPLRHPPVRVAEELHQSRHKERTDDRGVEDDPCCEADRGGTSALGSPLRPSASSSQFARRRFLRCSSWATATPRSPANSSSRIRPSRTTSARSMSGWASATGRGGDGHATARVTEQFNLIGRVGARSPQPFLGCAGRHCRRLSYRCP
jgi:hypothetical protein